MKKEIIFFVLLGLCTGAYAATRVNARNVLLSNTTYNGTDIQTWVANNPMSYSGTNTTFNGTVLSTKAGPCGIGTTQPAYTLDVNGTVRSSYSYVTNKVGVGTTTPAANLTVVGTVQFDTLKSTTGTRYLCIGTAGNITSSATACSGT